MIFVALRTFYSRNGDDAKRQSRIHLQGTSRYTTCLALGEEKSWGDPRPIDGLPSVALELLDALNGLVVFTTAPKQTKAKHG